MSEDLDSISEEEPSLFRPFTRESLAAIEARIADELARQKENEKKRAEGEVRDGIVVVNDTNASEGVSDTSGVVCALGKCTESLLSSI